MKTLSDSVILYDQECPLCRLYTGAFVRAGMLEPNGRMAYQQMPENLIPAINTQRAVDEIALLNTQTGEVVYGVESLVRIVGHSRPGWLRVLRIPLVDWFARKLYRLISYNRRVIVPPTGAEPAGKSCAPSFSLKYRLAFILASWLFTSLVLLQYTTLLAGMVAPTSYGREFLVCGGQIVWQSAFLFLNGSKSFWNYLGNMMTISFAGALLLGVVLVLASFVAVSATAAAIYFSVVVFLMFAEHLRRAKLLRLGPGVSISWVLYRLFVLALLTSFL